MRDARTPKSFGDLEFATPVVGAKRVREESDTRSTPSRPLGEQKLKRVKKEGESESQWLANLRRTPSQTSSAQKEKKLQEEEAESEFLWLANLRTPCQTSSKQCSPTGGLPLSRSWVSAAKVRSRCRPISRYFSFACDSPLGDPKIPLEATRHSFDSFIKSQTCGKEIQPTPRRLAFTCGPPPGLGDPEVPFHATCQSFDPFIKPPVSQDDEIAMSQAYGEDHLKHYDITANGATSLTALLEHRIDSQLVYHQRAQYSPSRQRFNYTRRLGENITPSDLHYNFGTPDRHFNYGLQIPGQDGPPETDRVPHNSDRYGDRYGCDNLPLPPPSPKTWVGYLNNGVGPPDETEDERISNPIAEPEGIPFPAPLANKLGFIPCQYKAARLTEKEDYIGCLNNYLSDVDFDTPIRRPVLPCQYKGIHVTEKEDCAGRMHNYLADVDFDTPTRQPVLRVGMIQIPEMAERGPPKPFHPKIMVLLELIISRTATPEDERKIQGFEQDFQQFHADLQHFADRIGITRLFRTSGDYDDVYDALGELNERDDLPDLTAEQCREEFDFLGRLARFEFDIQTYGQERDFFGGPDEGGVDVPLQFDERCQWNQRARQALAAAVENADPPSGNEEAGKLFENANEIGGAPSGNEDLGELFDGSNENEGAADGHEALGELASGSDVTDDFPEHYGGVDAQILGEMNQQAVSEELPANDEEEWETVDDEDDEDKDEAGGVEVNEEEETSEEYYFWQVNGLADPRNIRRGTGPK